MNKVSLDNCYEVIKGTVMVEFALILPLLLLILFGITELGRALYQQNMLTQAVELGGRYLARIDGAVIEDGSGGCAKGEHWEDQYEAAVENLIKCGVDGLTGCTEPILPNIEIEYIELCGPDIAHESCSSPSACVITVKATANFNSIFGEDLISIPGYNIEGVTLNATTQERYIGR